MITNVQSVSVTYRGRKVGTLSMGNKHVCQFEYNKDWVADGIVPFIITDDLKLFYYRGLREWGHINGFLTDTCLTAQDQYKSLLDYFKIKYQ